MSARSEEGSSSSAADTEAAFRKIMLEKAQPPKGRSPMLVVMWGGICCGKSTAATLLLERLNLRMEGVVDVNVDSLVYHIPGVGVVRPEHKETLTPTAKAAYMQGRKAAKSMQTMIADEAVGHGMDIYIEWTNEDNLHDLSCGKSTLFDHAKLEAKGYLIVICLVECRDIEGIIVTAAERETVDGRHIPEDIIRSYNRDRTLHFVKAIKKFSSPVRPVRNFVLTRMSANSAGKGLFEVTGKEIDSSAEVDDDAACTAIDALSNKGVYWQTRNRAGKGLLLCLAMESPPYSVVSGMLKTPLDCCVAAAPEGMIRMGNELKALRKKGDDGYLSDGELDDLERREAKFQRAKEDGVAIGGAAALPHFSQFKVNQGLSGALEKKCGQVAYAASTDEMEVILEVRGACSQNQPSGAVLSTEKIRVQSTWTGLVLKSVVIQTSAMSGGFGDFVMECAGASFHSRAPIVTNPNLKSGCTITIRKRGSTEARRTGET
jgi:hypothetical protein